MVLTYVPAAADPGDGTADESGRRRHERGRELIAERPVPGQPRPYDFPTTVRTTLANGLRVIVTPMPGRRADRGVLVLRTGAGRRARRRSAARRSSRPGR